MATFDIGYIRYTGGFDAGILVASLVGVIVLIGVVILTIVLYWKIKIARKDLDRTRTNIINMQLDVADDITKG